eukprot:scaffold37689_cov49-Attheya_sp.AAC.1
MDNFTTFTDRSLTSPPERFNNSLLTAGTILILIVICYCAATIENTFCWSFCRAKARKKTAEASLVTKKVQDHEGTEPCGALEGLNIEILTCPICIEPYVVGEEGVDEGMVDLEANSRMSNPDCGSAIEKSFELKKVKKGAPDIFEDIQIETVLSSRSECNRTVTVCVG